MASNNAFSPNYRNGGRISASTTNSLTSVVDGASSNTIVFTNLGANTVWVEIAQSGSIVANTTSDYPVLPNTQVSLTKPLGNIVIAAITETGTSTLHYVLGEGI